MVNTVLQGLFVLEAAKMCKAGVPMEACVNELLDMRESGRIFFTIGSIDYLKHGGRIESFLAWQHQCLELNR